MSHPELTEREIERVLAGHQPPGRPDLAEVAFLIARLRTMGDFEQAPPMSPRLLAELDASEVVSRDDPVPPRTRVQRQRTRILRRRWRLVSAAALVVVVGGLIALGAQNVGDGQRTEIDAQRTDATEPTTSTTAATSSTTIPSTTTAPPTTQPSTTTTAAAPLPAPVETTEIPAEGTPPVQWPDDGSGTSDEIFEQWERYCEDHPHQEECEWWEDFREPYGPYGDGGESAPRDGR